MSTATCESPESEPAQSPLRLGDRVLAPTYSRPDLLFVRGEGSWLEDTGGRRYLDMSSGIAVTALGHDAAAISAALADNAHGLVHVSNLFHTAPPIELAAALARLSFADRVFFANSGAEANEGAIKFARLVGGADRRDIVYFDGSFHGRTLGALAATDRPDYQAPFAPLPEGFRKAAWDDQAGLDAIDGNVAAVIVEPIQGEAGIRIPDPAWLVALRARCDEVGALLIFDEVQCGLGRTGHLWAHEATGVVPDIMTLAKPLAGGLPMGAILMTERVAEHLRPGHHATTFGGGPLVATVALAVLEVLSAPEFLADVRRKGALFRDRLAALDSPLVAEIRGRGLFVGLKLRVPPRDVRMAALDEGLLVVPAGDDVLRFLPPLNVADAELDEAVVRLERALDRHAAQGVER